MLKFTSEIAVELLRSLGSDRTIAEAAWVSTGAYKGDDAVPGLISYLMKHKHGTPFEQATMTFRVHAPIFVWREWHRHRIGFSYNEESGRYKKLEPVFYIPPRGRPMLKVEDWKPGRPKFLTLDDDSFYEAMLQDMCQGYEDEYARYERQLARGLDPGLARDNLPVGIYSTCIVACNPRSLMAFLELRTSDSGKSYPLYEIEVAAKACEMHFVSLFPHTWNAFQTNGRIAP